MGSGQPVCNTVPRVRGCDLDPVRELPYRPAAVRCRPRGRTDGSIRPRATTVLKFPLARKGASTDVVRIGWLVVGAGPTHEGLRSYRWGPLGEGTGAETLQNPATGGVSWQNA